jgi:hypothetical protein
MTDPIIEAMARDLCKQDGHNPDNMRGGFDREQIWKSWAPECRAFLRTYRAMVKAEASHEPQEAKEASGAIIDAKD